MFEENLYIPKEINQIIFNYARNPTCDEFKNMLSSG
jgi:hypothetical protein